MRAVDYLHKVKGALSSCECLADQIEEVVNLLCEAKQQHSRIYVLGNGGSASTAQHFSLHLAKDCGLDARSLVGDTPLLTALANDEGYPAVFEAQLKDILRPEDIVIGISCSGRSSNVLNVLSYARWTAMAKTVSLTMNDGGDLPEVSDVYLKVPTTNMQIAEDLHLILVHCILLQLMERLK